MRLRYTDRAVEDLDIAFDWYEKQKRGLVLIFADFGKFSHMYSHTDFTPKFSSNPRITTKIYSPNFIILRNPY